MLAKVTLLSLALPLLAHADEKWKRPIYLTCPTKKKNMLELVIGEVGTQDLEVVRARFKGKRVTAIAYDFAKGFSAPPEAMPRKAPFVEAKKLPAELVRFVKETEDLNRKICLGKKQDKRFFEIDLEMNRQLIYGAPAEPTAK